MAINFNFSSLLDGDYFGNQRNKLKNKQLGEGIMMSDQQFEELMEKIVRKQEDHDLLIEIKTLIAGIVKGETDCKADVITRIGEIKLATNAAHKRIDGMWVSGVLALVLVALSIYLTK